MSEAQQPCDPLPLNKKQRSFLVSLLKSEITRLDQHCVGEAWYEDERQTAKEILENIWELT